MKRVHKKRPVIDRFNEKWEAVTETGCWLWNAGRNPRGYGQLSRGWKEGPALAHRVSWSLHRGPIPDGLHVLHKCDTPACVNPDHLFVGTDKDNFMDMVAKGRYIRPQLPFGESHGQARISNEVAMAIFFASGVQHEIAKQFGVKKATVNHIKSGRQWSKVTGKEFVKNVSNR